MKIIKILRTNENEKPIKMPGINLTQVVYVCVVQIYGATFDAIE